MLCVEGADGGCDSAECARNASCGGDCCDEGSEPGNGKEVTGQSELEWDGAADNDIKPLREWCRDSEFV